MTPEITIAEGIKIWRIDRGLNQSQAAEVLGITRSQYNRIERGKATNPRLHSIWVFLQERTKLEAQQNCSNSSDHYHLVATREELQ